MKLTNVNESYIHRLKIKYWDCHSRKILTELQVNNCLQLHVVICHYSSDIHILLVHRESTSTDRQLIYAYCHAKVQ